MVKRTRTRRNKSVGGKKENILRKSVKKLTKLNSKLIKKINLFNLLKKTKRRKHKHRGGG